jgi:hypothetical protein
MMHAHQRDLSGCTIPHASDGATELPGISRLQTIRLAGIFIGFCGQNTLFVGPAERAMVAPETLDQAWT